MTIQEFKEALSARYQTLAVKLYNEFLRQQANGKCPKLESYNDWLKTGRESTDKDRANEFKEIELLRCMVELYEIEFP